MALKRRDMTIYMNDPAGTDGASEHRISLLLADQMRGELEVKKRGLGTGYAINLGAAMAWSCMARLGLTDLDFDAFSLECLSIQDSEPEPSPTGEPTSDDVDPTQPAASNDSA